jgi:hypothetical protein
MTMTKAAFRNHPDAGTTSREISAGLYICPAAHLCIYMDISTSNDYMASLNWRWGS